MSETPKKYSSTSILKRAQNPKGFNKTDDILAPSYESQDPIEDVDEQTYYEKENLDDMDDITVEGPLKQKAKSPLKLSKQFKPLKVATVTVTSTSRSKEESDSTKTKGANKGKKKAVQEKSVDEEEEPEQKKETNRDEKGEKILRKKSPKKNDDTAGKSQETEDEKEKKEDVKDNTPTKGNKKIKVDLLKNKKLAKINQNDEDKKQDQSPNKEKKDEKKDDLEKKEEVVPKNKKFKPPTALSKPSVTVEENTKKKVEKKSGKKNQDDQEESEDKATTEETTEVTNKKLVVSAASNKAKDKGKSKDKKAEKKDTKKTKKDEKKKPKQTKKAKKKKEESEDEEEDGEDEDDDLGESDIEKLLADDDDDDEDEDGFYGDGIIVTSSSKNRLEYTEDGEMQITTTKEGQDTYWKKNLRASTGSSKIRKADQMTNPHAYDSERTLKMIKSSKNVIMFSGLEEEEVGLLYETVERLGKFTIEKDSTPYMTHLIYGGDKRTMKLLFAIAKRAWILSSAFLYSSVEFGKWVSEKECEFPGVPDKKLRDAYGPLFKDIKFFFNSGEVEYFQSIAVEELKLLIKLGGGKVLENVEDADVVIENSEDNENSMAGKDFEGTKPHIISYKWIFDSLMKYSKLSYQDYEISD